MLVKIFLMFINQIIKDNSNQMKSSLINEKIIEKQSYDRINDNKIL